MLLAARPAKRARPSDDDDAATPPAKTAPVATTTTATAPPSAIAPPGGIALPKGAIALPGGRFYVPARNDPFFSRPLPRSVPRPGQPVVSLRALADAKRWYPLERQRGAAHLVPRRQKGHQWFLDRYGKVTGSTLSKFLGWVWGNDDPLDAILGARNAYWRTQLLSYEEAQAEGVGGLSFRDDRDEAMGRERMQWGCDHEDDALVTLLHYRPALSVRECVLQDVLDLAPPEHAARSEESKKRRAVDESDPAPAPKRARTDAAPEPERAIFGDSQDGAGVAMDGTFTEDGVPRGIPISCEFKCTYASRDPHLRATVHDYYLAQALFHTVAERSTRTYFEIWTPDLARIWVVPPCPALLERIGAYICALLADDEWARDINNVLAEAAFLRAECARYAREQCRELEGSPFVSCFAERDAAGKIITN